MSDHAVIGGPALSAPIRPSLLGGEYLGWTGLPGWQVQADHLGIGHVRWPGGIVAEDRQRDGIWSYDLTTPDLMDNWPRHDGSARPGLTDMLALSRETGRSASVIVPTARYVEAALVDETAALDRVRAEVGAFAARLVAGDFGPLPDGLILEVGAEYYSTDVWEETGGAPAVRDLFAKVFAAAVGALDDARAAAPGAFDIAVQSGRFQSKDDPVAGDRDGEAADSLAFLDAFAALGVTDAIDALVWHRYTHHWAQIPTFFREAAHPSNVLSTLLSDHVALWSGALGREPDLVMSWLSPDVDSTGASATDPWFDHGPRAGGNILQMFAEIAAAGVDTATLYGIDSPWPGAVTTGGTTPADLSVSFAGETYALLTESVAGLSVLGVHLTNEWKAGPDNAAPWTGDVDFYAFAGDGRMVVFARAQGFDGASLRATIALPDLDPGLVRATRLTPDGDGADAGGVRTDAALDWTDDGFAFDFTRPFEILRVEIAKDAVAALTDELEVWTNAAGHTVTIIPEGDPPPDPAAADLSPTYADDFVF